MIMSWFQNNALVIVLILLVLNIIEGLIIYFLSKKKTKSKGRNKGDSVRIAKYEKVYNDLTVYREKFEQLRNNYRKKEKECGEYYIKFVNYKEKHDKIIVEIQELKQGLKDERTRLEQKIDKLIRENDELKNKLVGNEPAPNVPETVAMDISTPVIPNTKEELVDKVASKSSQTSVQDVVSAEVAHEANTPKEEPNNNPIKEELKVEPATEEPKNEPSKGGVINETTNVETNVEPSKEKTLYASFPRSAGSSIYFSDLSEDLVEDSYFEIKISIASGKATFKPLDFMKIRNYDPAMAAMRTEGVKPNVASTVQGIEHGKAHKEGKDWIIDNPAKIKLA